MIDTGGYTREILRRTETQEIVLITWSPDARTPAHDHNVMGEVFVLRGSVYEIVNGKKINHKQGAIIAEIPGSIHEMGADEAALTLHIYAGKLVMNIYPSSAIM